MAKIRNQVWSTESSKSPEKALTLKSFRTKTMRGQRNERMARGECNNQLARQDDERVVQWEDDKRRWDNQLAWQDDTMAARREATQPHSLLGLNEIGWWGGSHGHARVECKLEWLGVGDELQVVSNVVQKDLRSFRHMKDQRTKMAHCFVRVLQGSNWFWSAKCLKFVEW